MNNEPPKLTLREAAEMAVDVLEHLGYDPVDLREALAEQAEQEPVAIVEDWPTDSTPKGIVALCDIKELPAGTLLYASPATSTEVFTREKVDSLLIAAYTKGRNDLLEKQAEQEPVAWGRVFDGDIIDCICPEEHALNEGDYTIPLYTQPVRTKDLTDDELNKLLDYWSEDERSAYGGAWSADGEYVDMKSFARSAIAADREKNK